MYNRFRVYHNFEVKNNEYSDLFQIPDSNLARGVLPSVLRTLIQKRREVKKLIKTERDPAKLAGYDIRQKVRCSTDVIDTSYA